jgi:serine/threonine-protein phosphatase 5
MSTYHVSLVLSFFEWMETNLICTTYVCLFHILIKVHNSFRSLEVEPHYAGPRIDGEEITIDFVKAMLDEFKKQKCIHKRYIIS